MGNRHHHKKARAEARARMARTGETYQQALARLRALGPRRSPHDLLAVEYFGVAATVATFEIAGTVACLVVSSALHRGPLPHTPLAAIASARAVH